MCEWKLQIWMQLLIEVVCAFFKINSFLEPVAVLELVETHVAARRESVHARKKLRVVLRRERQSRSLIATAQDLQLRHVPALPVHVPVGIANLDAIAH
jgi:hypothetical protein